MSVRSLQDQIDSLLNKGVAQPKVGGVPRPDIETASVIESLALALMLQPKSAFYVHYLAKNGLVVAIDKEISAIDTLKTTVQDLGNVTYAIKDTKALSRAQAAILQLSTQGQVSSDSSAFERYSVAVDDFLEKQLGKNIKRPGATEMVRPGEEAGLALPGDLLSVEDAHTDFLNRLYALAVGIVNFANTPFSTLVGSNAVYRTKKDLDDLAETIKEDESGSQSRDAAIRLISGRATIRLIGAPLDMTEPVVDTVRHLPPDKLLSGESLPTAAVAQTAVGPFVMAPFLGPLQVTVDGQTVTTSALNQANNTAAILGKPVSLPLTVPDNYHLFLRLEAISGLSWTGPVHSVTGPTDQDTYLEPGLGVGWLLDAGVFFKVLKVVLNSGSNTAPPGPAAQPMSMAAILAAINASLGSSSVGTAVEFVQPGSSRILIFCGTNVAKISIAGSASAMEDQSNGQAGDVGSTQYVYRVYTNSYHSALGFEDNQVGTKGSTPGSRIFEALSIVFPALPTSIVLPFLNTDQSISLTTQKTTPGISIDLAGAWRTSLGLATSYQATSPSVALKDSGTVVSPIGVVDVGDVLLSSSGTATISELRLTSMVLSPSLRTFSGNITVTSALYLVWQEIDSQVRSFLSTWVDGPYASGLVGLDRLIAVLIGSPTSPRRTEAIALLDDLKSKLLTIRNAVTSAGATLPTGSATKEKAAINNVIATFTERKLDRALDFLLKCALQEIFELDWQSASYSGNLMKAVEGIAQKDVQFPDTTKDEGFDVGGTKALRNNNG